MIEVSITFDTSDGTGVETYTVNVDPPRGAFSSMPYVAAINRALEEFASKYLQAIPARVTTRDVPPKAAVLEVKWPK